MSFIDRVIVTFILGLAQIIATETLLGVVFKKLYASPLFFLNVAVSVVLLFIAFFAGGKAALKSGPVSGKSLFGEIKDESNRFFKMIQKDWILLCIFSFFIISLCWMIFLGYLFPSYTWDALWYHLPIVGYIMQSGAIQEVSNNSFIDRFINIFPKNIELFFVWNIIFLKSDVITDLSQLLFTITGVLTIYSMAVKLGIRERYATYSSLLFFFTPVMILQSTTNYVDVAITVLFLIAVNFVMCDFKTGKAGNAPLFTPAGPGISPLLFTGITAGILLGSKGSGPLFVVILSVVVFIQEVIRFSDISSCAKRFLKSIQHYVIYFLLPVLLIGGYWYIKNWVLYGNPVYPMEISVFNTVIFKGLFRGIIEPAPEVINRLTFLTRPVYVWTENIKYYLYDSRLGGLGPIWFILFVPSVAYALFYALARKKYDFLAVFTILVAAFLMYPRNWTPRYVIFIVGLGALSFGLVLDYFYKRENMVRVVALVLATYTVITSNSPCVVPDEIREMINLPSDKRTISRHAPFNIDVHARQEYGYWIWISDNISKGDSLAYTFEPLFLSPLWNREFSSRIIYVKSDVYKEWLKNLRENDVTYVLVRSNSEEDKWIEKERSVFYSLRWMGNIVEKFKVVYSDENYKIVKFNKG